MSEMNDSMSIELFDIGNTELYRSEDLPHELLRVGIERNIQKAENAAKKIYKTVVKQAPTGTQLTEATKKGVRYVLDLDEETVDKIEKGVLKLTNENGKLRAQYRMPDGTYGSRIDVTREVFSKGIDPVQMSTALQMKALQDQIENIERQIQVIGESVTHVIQGLQNDRIGLYYSGVRLYLEALHVSDPELRRLLVSQALRSLSDAAFQLIFEIKTDIKYLANEEYKKQRNKKELIIARMESIDQSFVFIHRAMLMRAAIYSNEGELTAMASVLTDYSHFIEGVIARNANMLAQCDLHDTGLPDGIWRSRGTLRLDAAEFAKRLSLPNQTLYLGLTEGEKDHEE